MANRYPIHCRLHGRGCGVTTCDGMASVPDIPIRGNDGEALYYPRCYKAGEPRLLDPITAEEFRNLQREAVEVAPNSKVEDLTRVVKEGFEEIKGEFATAHQEHQKIDKEVVGTRRGLGAVLRHIKDWKTIVCDMLLKRKIPWGKVEKAVGEDRYGKVDWSKIKHEDGIRQIKDVIDYTYDVKPVTLGVSKKNLKATGGITLADACNLTALLHKDEWAKFTDPYPTAKGLYVACHDLATRKREKNPFKVV